MLILHSLIYSVPEWGNLTSQRYKVLDSLREPLRLGIPESTNVWQSHCTFQGGFTKRPVNIRYGNYRACVYHLQGAELEPLVSKHLFMCEDSQEACAELLLLSQYVFSCKHLKSLLMSLSVYSHLSSTELHQVQYLVWTSGVCMQVASKHNRNPGFNVDKKEIALSLWDWSTPQWYSRSQPSFSPAVFFTCSLSLSSLVLVCHSWSHRETEHWTAFPESTAFVLLLFFPAWIFPPVVLVFLLEKRKPLESWGRDRQSCGSVCCEANTVCLEICTALCLPWMQHCGGRAEVKNQNLRWALACLNTVQEVWIAWSWGSCCSLLTEALC